jgi:tetratricopeptide (TPR) repeat protein
MSILKQAHRSGNLIICLLVSLFFLSCNSSKKAGASKGSSKNQPLTDDEEVAFKSAYYDANTKKILGDYDQALVAFLQCLNIDPGSAAANYEVADILEYEKQPDSALIFVSRSVKKDPSNTWYEELYAQCLQDKGKYREVAEVYRNLIKEHPGAADYYYKLAVAELQSGSVTQAAQTYQEAEEKLGFNEQVAMNIVEIYERAKDYADAEKEIQELIKRSPDVPQYSDMLGNLYDLEGKSEKAFEVYQHMEQTSPDDPMVHLSLADYYRAKHDDNMAFNELEMAFKQSSLEVDTKIRILIGSFYAASTGNDSLSRQGMKLCELMIEAEPKNPKAHLMYGDFLFRSMNLQKAREQYQIAIGEDSSKYTPWEKLLQTDELLHDNEGLANASKLAIGLFPNNANLYFLNGIANSQLKQYKESLNSLHRGMFYVIEDSALLGNFLALMGEVSNSLGDYHASDSAYEAALKINPKDDGVLNNYSYYLSLRDTNLDRAAAMSQKANNLVPNNGTYEDTYAWILYKQGKFQDAKDWEDKSLLHGGAKDNAVLDHYGDILYKLGDKDKALEYWQKAKDGGLQSDVLDKKIRDKRLYEK